MGRAVQATVNEDPKRSAEKWVFVGTKDADLCAPSSVRTLFEAVRPTHVLHLAAKVGGLYANSRDNVGFFRENVQIQVQHFWMAACAYLCCAYIRACRWFYFYRIT